jgi:hypothetical protein
MLTYNDRLRLAAETKLSLRTVEKWAKGGQVTQANDQLLLRVASELGLCRENEAIGEES